MSPEKTQAPKRSDYQNDDQYHRAYLQYLEKNFPSQYESHTLQRIVFSSLQNPKRWDRGHREGD